MGTNLKNDEPRELWWKEEEKEERERERAVGNQMTREEEKEGRKFSCVKDGNASVLSKYAESHRAISHLREILYYHPSKQFFSTFFRENVIFLHEEKN